MAFYIDVLFICRVTNQSECHMYPSLLLQPLLPLNPPQGAETDGFAVVITRLKQQPIYWSV